MVDVQTLHRHELRCSPALLEWLADEAVSLAVVAGGRLVVVSAAPTIGDTTEVALDGVAAVAWDGDSLWVFDRWQLWRFVDALAGAADGALRRLLLPRAGHTVGLVGRQRPGDDVGGTPPRLVAVRLPGCARRTVGLPSRVGATLADRPPARRRSGLSGVAVRDGLADAVTLTTKSDEPGSDHVARG